jgi:hypothetical protein
MQPALSRSIERLKALSLRGERPQCVNHAIRQRQHDRAERNRAFISVPAASRTLFQRSWPE